MFNQKQAMRKMHNALLLQFDFLDPVSMLPITKKRFLTLERRKKAIANLGLNLCIIFGDAFFAGLRRYAQYKHRYTEEFLFSINMLDRAIENVLAEKNEKTRKQILTKLPDEYQNFADVFSKSESSILLSHRSIDYKIELLPDAALFKVYSLYSMLADQLIALKEYFTEALRKK
jgi:hypothetical protein